MLVLRPFMDEISPPRDRSCNHSRSMGAYLTGASPLLPQSRDARPRTGISTDDPVMLVLRQRTCIWVTSEYAAPWAMERGCLLPDAVLQLDWSKGWHMQIRVRKCDTPAETSKSGSLNVQQCQTQQQIAHKLQQCHRVARTQVASDITVDLLVLLALEDLDQHLELFLGSPLILRGVKICTEILQSGMMVHID